MTLMKNAKTFWVAWFGDGATIKCMPLLNLLALCGEEPPVLISIFDCSDHMSEGGKRMHCTLSSCSRTKLLRLIQLLHAIRHSFLLVQAMFKKLEKSSVKHTLWLFVSMKASMCSLYFSVILIFTNQSKQVYEIFRCLCFLLRF